MKNQTKNIILFYSYIYLWKSVQIYLFCMSYYLVTFLLVFISLLKTPHPNLRFTENTRKQVGILNNQEKYLYSLTVAGRQKL